MLDGFALDFSTGSTIDTLRISGIVLQAENLEPAHSAAGRPAPGAPSTMLTCGMLSTSAAKANGRRLSVELRDSLLDSTTYTIDFADTIAMSPSAMMSPSRISTTLERSALSGAASRRHLSLGEIDQIFNAREHSISKANYMAIIDYKTASLFVSSARMGCLAAGVDDWRMTALEEYARAFGRCFQIRDDIFSATGERIVHHIIVNQRGIMKQFYGSGSLCSTRLPATT